jgi:hypothetical protein
VQVQQLILDFANFGALALIAERDQLVIGVQADVVPDRNGLQKSY